MSELGEIEVNLGARPLVHMDIQLWAQVGEAMYRVGTITADSTDVGVPDELHRAFAQAINEVAAGLRNGHEVLHP